MSNRFKKFLYHLQLDNQILDGPLDDFQKEILNEIGKTTSSSHRKNK